MKNKVQIIGNVGREPEVTTLSNGKKVARFSVATHENYKDADGKLVQNTSWHRMVAWGSMAGLIEKHITRGKEIAVEGKLQNSTYTGKNGEKRYSTEIVVNEVVFTGHRTEPVLPF